MKTETDFLFNRKDTAAAMGVSTQAIGTWELEHVKKEGATGNRVYYDIRDVIQYRLKRDVETGKVLQSLPHERTRLARLQADKEEIKVKRLRGELIPADAVIKHWEDMFLAFRAKILGIPPRAAMVAINATSIEDVEESMEKFLREALHELAGDGMPDEYKAMRQDSPQGTETTDTVNGQQVGG